MSRSSVMLEEVIVRKPPPSWFLSRPLSLCRKKSSVRPRRLIPIDPVYDTVIEVVVVPERTCGSPVLVNPEGDGQILVGHRTCGDQAG